MTKTTLLIAVGTALLVLAACQPPAPACPTGTGTPGPGTLAGVPPAATPGPPPAPALVTISGKPVTVDRVVDGPLCNDTWRGTVYVTCGVQVKAWERRPTFLQDCNLTIEPGTVVYVAHHYDAAYYKGCSCHTGELAVP